MMMKKTTVLGLGLAAMVASAGVATAADVSAGVDFASAYVFRGVTFNDGLVMQPGVDVTAPLGIEFGVWGNFDIDDYDDSLNGSQFSEVDLYMSYAIPIEAFDLGVGYCEYLYPGAEGDADREVSVSAGTAVEGVDMDIGVYYGVDGGIDKSLYVEASIGYAMELAEATELSLGATAAFADFDGGESGFHNYTVSAGLSYKVISAGVTYIGQGDDEVLTDAEYDVDVVGTIGIGYDF
jgi:uncharacterized protein (TIGR02001 family)